MSAVQNVISILQDHDSSDVTSVRMSMPVVDAVAAVRRLNRLTVKRWGLSGT